MTVSLFDSIARSVNLQCRTILVVLSSEQSPNLKNAIKCINQRATSRNPDPEDEASVDEARVSNAAHNRFFDLLMPIEWSTLELRPCYS